MADFQSKYSGEQVEALLDIVKQGGTGGGGGEGEVQKTTEAEITAMGFTKNLGTITEIKMNGVSKGTSGVVDLGSVITSHQDISGKQDKLVSGENIKTVNGQSLLGNGDIVIGGCESLTYEEFVSKVNNSELVEGCLYRITDYETVVAGDYLTTAPNHGFDLIVLATSSNSYSNKCWATPTERYQYPPYPNCQLGKWQIWWSHERTNQIWVPEAGHKGVIYRMIDEWGNDCPYDFKSIMLKVPDFASEVNGTLGTIGSLADSYYPTFTIMIDSEIHDASVYLNSFEDDSTFCANNVIKSSIVDGYNDEDSSPFPYVLFLASCGDTYSDLGYKRIYNNVIGESTTGVLFFAECNYFNFSNNCIGKNSANIRLIARQDDLQNYGNILSNNFGDNCEDICLEASGISYNFIDSGSYAIHIPTVENLPRTPYQSISELIIGKNVSSISTDFGSEKQEYVLLSALHVGDSSYDIHFRSSYGTPVDGFATNIGKNCHGLYIDLTYSPTVNIGDGCTDITVNGICAIGDGCSSIEYISETGASQLTFNSGVHDLYINPLDGIKATVIAGSPTGSADDIVDQTVAKPENGPDNADYLLYVNGQNKWVAEPIVSLDKVVKYQDNLPDLKSIRVDILEDGMVYALPLGSEEAKAYADCVLQEKIDDLDAIRSGAEKGATALQSVPSEYVTESQLMWTKVEGEAGVRLKGTNGTATGNLAISAGDDKTASDGTTFASVASGDHAVAFGYGNTCAGRTTLAQGLYNIVNSKDSVAFGQRNIVNGDQAFAVGQQNEVSARIGVAIGYKNKATNTDSIAIGYQNISSGSASVAMGDTCEANGTSSTAMGYKTKATGAYTSTFGQNTQATNDGEVAMGSYNKSTTSTEASEQTLFSFGIGTSDTNRANAFEIKKNGDVYIGDKIVSVGEGSGGSNEKEIVTVTNGIIEVLEPNKIYLLENLDLIFEIQSIAEPTGDYGEYSVIISAESAIGDNSAQPSISLPEGLLWANGRVPDITGQGIYELNIVFYSTSLSGSYQAVLTPFKSVI